MAEQVEKKMGWEIASKVEQEKPTMAARAKLEKEKWITIAKYMIAFAVMLAIAWWLASNPFEYTQRMASEYTIKNNLVGTDNWNFIWWVILVCAFFEFLDSSAGMGYGTALSPLMLSFGFDPEQVIPLIMISEMLTGFISGLIHGEMENVEWKWWPMNETTKLVVGVAITGMLASAISITAIYKILMVHKFWVRMYVAMLLIMMGVCSLYTAKTWKKYRPGWMWGFAFLGGFNKGIGGGGYGPVITVGGVIAGIPVKSMVAITSYAEAFTCVAAVVTWGTMIGTGTIVDFGLLPNFIIGAVLAAVGAPFMTRVFPEKFWKYLIPVYCCGLAVYAFYRIWPEVQKRLG